MVRHTAALFAAILIAPPLQAQQDANVRHADSLRTLLRPIVRNRDQIRVVRYDGLFIVEQPRVWLDTLRQTEPLRRVQVRGNSSATGAKIGGVVGLVAGAVTGAAAGVALNNMCILGCPSRSAGENQSAALLGGLVGSVGGALVGTGVGALIGLAIPSWHTRISVRNDGRFEIR